MQLLMQVDCTALAPLPDFPHEGLLQWFIARDDLYGMDFDDMCSGKGHRVLYHESVDPGVTEADVRAKMPSEPPPYDFTPLGEKAFRIVFEAAEVQPIPAGDVRFGNAFVKRWNALRPEAAIESVWALCQHFDAEDFLVGETPEKLVHHQVGGYPYFTQSDPREMGEYPDMDTLLLQLDSDMQGGGDLVLWGDCGIGNLFISREALKTRDFSRTGYNWDCC